MKAVALIIALAVGVLLALPLGHAEQPKKVFKVAELWMTNPSTFAPYQRAFRQGLHELGYVEGRDIIFETRYANGQYEGLPGLAAELVRLNPDVILTGGNQLLAVKQATNTIPVVTVTCDSVEAFASSLARPGANVTGVSCISVELAPKRLQLLKEAVPTATRVAVLYNPSDPHKRLELNRTETAARVLGLTLRSVEVRQPTEIGHAFSTLATGGAQAVVVLPDGFTIQHRRAIIERAATARLPAMYGFREFVETGGLMSYGTTLAGMYGRLASYVDKILRGAKPGDLPIEEPTRFELVINLKTAKALGLTIPQSLLVRADEVIK